MNIVNIVNRLIKFFPLIFLLAVGCAENLSEISGNFGVNPLFQPLTVSVTDATLVTEGGTLVFAISISEKLESDLQVSYTTSNGTAIAGVDYTTTSGDLIIPAGETNGTVSVPTIENTTGDGTRNLSLTISNPSQGALGQATASGEISDNEPSVVVDFTTTGQTINEVNGTATVTIRLTGGVSPVDVTVPYTLSGSANPTAVAPADYTLADGTITIPAGQVLGTLTFPIIDDALTEINETIVFTLGTPINALLGPNTVHSILLLSNE